MALSSLTTFFCFTAFSGFSPFPGFTLFGLATFFCSLSFTLNNSFDGIFALSWLYSFWPCDLFFARFLLRLTTLLMEFLRLRLFGAILTARRRFLPEDGTKEFSLILTS